MPIRVINSTYIEYPFGSTTSFLQSNAGDTTRGTWTIEESISVTTDASTSINNDLLTNIFDWLGGDFEAEGFRPGDTIDIVVYDANTGVVVTNNTTTVTWVDEGEMKVADSGSSWYSYPTTKATISNQRNREGLELNFNMVSNGSQGSEFSLIDGEPTRFIINLTNPAFPTINQVGNQSGAYEIVLSMGLTSSSGNINTYDIRVEFTQSGIYNSALFDFNNCLKVYLGLNWQSLLGEPYSNTLEVVSDDANTGWFNQAFNNDIIDATLVQGISELAYDSISVGSFVIDSSSSKYCQGSAYIPGDESYYKNKLNSQAELSMIIPSDEVVLTTTPRTSFANPDGAQYDFQITAINVVGTTYTIEYKMTPNPFFTTFMEGRAIGDRTFYVWMKFGNVNILVFNGQLSKQPVVAGAINMVVSEYFDHSEQVTDSTAIEYGYSGNIEDDFGFVGKWRWPKKADVTYVRAGIEAWNVSTGDSFTLQQTQFSLANVPQDSTPIEAYILSLSQPVNTTLPNTSVKRAVELTRDASIDQAIFYGVKLYYPYIYRWEYWLNLPNADSDFYPNQQTRNWLPYGTTADWRLRLKLEYDLNGLAYEHYDEIGIKPYDDNSNILQEIELYRDNPLQNVQVVVEGELMRVVATHTNVDGSSWDVDDVWGMITIEPTESSPRYICSTAVPFDNNTLNPLTPLAGLYCDMTFPSPDVVRLECYFDTTKINLINGVKFTSKIKGCTDGEVAKLTTTGMIKSTTSGDNKLKS